MGALILIDIDDKVGIITSWCLTCIQSKPLSHKYLLVLHCFTFNWAIVRRTLRAVIDDPVYCNGYVGIAITDSAATVIKVPAHDFRGSARIVLECTSD
jgi:hypothetical protein